MAIADMFLKIQGVTGEARDADHKGEIEVVSWSWGMQAPTSVTGQASARASLSEVVVVKHVDQATPTLMGLLKNHKVSGVASLTVRKAGSTPLEYFRIDMENVRVTSVTTESESSELVEKIRLGFTKIKVVYTPQSTTGAVGGGQVMFEADAHTGS